LKPASGRPGQAISDPGFFNFGGHQFRDDKKGGHGSVDMYKSIVHSCDTYYYMLANDMGIHSIARFMRQLGFGSRDGKWTSKGHRNAYCLRRIAEPSIQTALSNKVVADKRPERYRPR